MSERLVADLADLNQRTTQTYARRPYGVWLLVASYDETGLYTYETCPSVHVYEYYVTAIGSKSQSWRTFLEKVYQNLKDMGRDELISMSLTGCVSGDVSRMLGEILIAMFCFIYYVIFISYIVTANYFYAYFNSNIICATFLII